RRSNTSSMRQNPTLLPYSCQAQFGMSGIGDPPAGGVSTVRGIVSSGFHSSTFTMTQTTSRAPPGNARRGRSLIAEYAQRSVGSTSRLLPDDGQSYVLLLTPIWQLEHPDGRATVGRVLDLWHQ